MALPNSKIFRQNDSFWWPHNTKSWDYFACDQRSSFIVLINVTQTLEIAWILQISQFIKNKNIFVPQNQGNN